MKPLAILKTTAVAFATLNLVLPMRLVLAEMPPVRANAPGAPIAVAKAADVVLGVQGRLSGQVVDASGKAQVELPVAIEQDGQKIAEAKTDKLGRFGFDNVRGGVCNIRVAGMVSTCRCWTANAAPPSAKPEVLVISDPQLERGQRPIGEILTNPLLIALIIAAAVAIPIAVHNSQTPGS